MIRYTGHVTPDSSSGLDSGQAYTEFNAMAHRGTQRVGGLRRIKEVTGMSERIRRRRKTGGKGEQDVNAGTHAQNKQICF